MKLLSVYKYPGAVDLLYRMLAERDPRANISHKAMPMLVEHAAFVNSKPYFSWFLIVLDETLVIGQVYLTKNREIGIQLGSAYQGHGYGPDAVKLLMERHPGKFLANISPRNARSIAMFEKLGFEPLQVTYEKRS